MKNDKPHTVIKLGSGLVGLLVLFAILVAANSLVGNLRLRTDLTDENLYSLSDGTLKTIAKIEQPVTLKLFFNSSNPEVPVQLKNYARQVEDLLREYELASKGMIELQKYDPKPDSEAEEWAQKYGLSGQPLDMFGPPVYFGLVAVSGKAEDTMPSLDPRMQQLLEYNVTRLIHGIAHPAKPVIGVFSSLPVLGMRPPPYPMPGQPPPQPQPAWVAFEDLRKNYELREIAALDEGVPAGLSAMLVVHPKELSDKAQFALDQYVLGGGHLVLFIDPMAFADQSAGAGSPYGMPGASSNADKLLRAWGIGYDPDKVLADFNAGTPMRTGDNRVERSPVVMTYGPENISRDDVSTARLELIRTAFAGALTDNTSSDITVTPLLTTTHNVALIDGMTARFGADAIARQAKKAGAAQHIALRLGGKFKTAFPDGRPKADEPADDAADKDAEKATPETEAKADNALKEGQSVVVIVADADMIYDPVCVEEINFFGAKAYRPLNENLSMFANIVEQMAGSEDLISIRSRGEFNRPFARVDKLERAAVERWQEKEKSLESRLQQAQARLNELQQEKTDNQRFILSERQKQEIESFRAEEFRVKQELKEVRKQLRSEIETLGIKLKFFNIALMPALVAAAGIAFGLHRKNR